MRPHSVAGDDPGAWARKSVQGWMMQEAEAVNWVASRLEAGAVREALDLLASCSRLLTIVGTGVSGLVAAKLAATFTSSGTPAMSLNASDALHGGLGVARRDDVVLAISNSGRTEETLLVVEQLSAAGIPVIALTGNTSSPLAALADVVIDTSVPAEACPLGTLPTASSTVVLAIGDALAVTLAEWRGWTLEDVARIHPAGSIGQIARARPSTGSSTAAGFA